MTAAEPFNLSSAAIKPHVYEHYRQLRENTPIHKSSLVNGDPLWVVTRYDDVLAIFKDERFVKDMRNAMTKEELAQLPQAERGFDFLGRTMLLSDPPDHTRLRALVSKAFTPRRIEELRPRIQQIADELLAAVADQPTFDLLDAYAFPLPIMVISEMLGIPHADRDQFREWSNIVINNETMIAGDPERMAALMAFGIYIRNLVADRRTKPANDMISALIAAEEQGDSLAEYELIAMIFLLIVAGHETTVNLIGNGMLALLTNPDQLTLLKRQPDLIRSAIEEFLRYDGPVETSTMRFAREDLDYKGHQIKRGERVMVVIGAADRDPEQFANPDDVDITRQIKHHMAFGHGIHYCLGAPLARMEGHIAIQTLLDRMPNLHLAVPAENLRYRPSMIVRGLEEMPVSQEP